MKTLTECLLCRKNEKEDNTNTPRKAALQIWKERSPSQKYAQGKRTNEGNQYSCNWRKYTSKTEARTSQEPRPKLGKSYTLKEVSRHRGQKYV